MRTAVTQIQPRQYRVDFPRLRREKQGFLKRLFGNDERLEVDPFLIAQAVRTAMNLCETRSVHGRPLVWNEYKIFLSSRDYEGLLPLLPPLKAGLDSVIRETLDELEADTLGDPVVRILTDESAEVPQSIGEILVGFVENKNLAPPADGEVTVRVSRAGLPAAAAAAESTRRVPEPPGSGTLRLAWEDQEFCIPLGEKVLVGRPHAHPPECFVPLIGATQRINSRQLAIENAADGAVVTRLANANPVQIGGRLIQKGGKISLSELPAEIILSNGELVLRLLAGDA